MISEVFARAKDMRTHQVAKDLCENLYMKCCRKEVAFTSNNYYIDDAAECTCARAMVRGSKKINAVSPTKSSARFECHFAILTAVHAMFEGLVIMSLHVITRISGVMCNHNGKP